MVNNQSNTSNNYITTNCMSQKANSPFSKKQAYQAPQSYSFFFNRDLSQKCEFEENRIPISIQNLYGFPSPSYLTNMGYGSYSYPFSSFVQEPIAAGYPFYLNSYSPRQSYMDFNQNIPKIQPLTQASIDQQNYPIKRQSEQDYDDLRENTHGLKNLKQRQIIKNQEKTVKIQVIQEIEKVNVHEFRKQYCYLPETLEALSRIQRVRRYLIKKSRRTYTKRIVYQCRKSVADNRQRFKGRFVKTVSFQQKANNKNTAKQIQNANVAKQ